MFLTSLNHHAVQGEAWQMVIRGGEAILDACCRILDRIDKDFNMLAQKTIRVVPK